MLLRFFALGIPVGFFAAGCGQAGDAGSDQGSTPTEESIPDDAEMVSLKVEGMT